MRRINNRCVESLNISVEVAKCGKYSQIHPVHSLLSNTKMTVVTKQSIHVKLSSYESKNKLPWCVESLNISEWVAKCENFHIWSIHLMLSTLHSLSVNKNDLCWLNNPFNGFQHIRMSSYAKYKQQICWVTQHQCRSRICENIHKFTQYTHFLSVTQQWLVLPKQSIHGKLSTH